MLNIMIIFPGYSNCNFENLLNKFSKYEFLLKNIFKKSSKILKCNLLELVKNNKNLINNENFQIISINISLFIWNTIKNLLYSYKNKINLFMTGYSLGEYAALLCSNYINFYDITKILFIRNKLMNNIIINNKKFSMAIIIGIKYNIINKFCIEINKIENEFVSISIFNSKNMFTISGYYTSIIKIVNMSRLYGSKKEIILPFKFAFHCKLMKPIINEFKKYLFNIDIKLSKISVINNIKAKIYNSKENIYKLLIDHIYNPVQWYKITKLFKKKKIDLLLEIGSNNIIKNLSNTNINNFSYISENDIFFIKKILKNV